VVESRRQAQSVYYSLAGPEVATIVSMLYELYCDPQVAKAETTSQMSGKKHTSAV
jgi:hypothetical protein